jgi:hypothetical protein
MKATHRTVKSMAFVARLRQLGRRRPTEYKPVEEYTQLGRVNLRRVNRLKLNQQKAK